MDIDESRKWRTLKYVTQCTHQYKDDEKKLQTYATVTCGTCLFEVCPKCAHAHPCKCLNEGCDEHTSARHVCLGCKTLRCINCLEHDCKGPCHCDKDPGKERIFCKGCWGWFCRKCSAHSCRCVPCGDGGTRALMLCHFCDGFFCTHCIGSHPCACASCGLRGGFGSDAERNLCFVCMRVFCNGCYESHGEWSHCGECKRLPAIADCKCGKKLCEGCIGKHECTVSNVLNVFSSYSLRSNKSVIEPVKPCEKDKCRLELSIVSWNINHFAKLDTKGKTQNTMDFQRREEKWNAKLKALKAIADSGVDAIALQEVNPTGVPELSKYLPNLNNGGYSFEKGPKLCSQSWQSREAFAKRWEIREQDRGLAPAKVLLNSLISAAKPKQPRQPRKKQQGGKEAKAEPKKKEPVKWTADIVCNQLMDQISSPSYARKVKNPDPDQRRVEALKTAIRLLAYCGQPKKEPKDALLGLGPEELETFRKRVVELLDEGKLREMALLAAKQNAAPGDAYRHLYPPEQAKAVSRDLAAVKKSLNEGEVLRKFPTWREQVKKNAADLKNKSGSGKTELADSMIVALRKEHAEVEDFYRLTRKLNDAYQEHYPLYYNSKAEVKLTQIDLYWGDGAVEEWDPRSGKKVYFRGPGADGSLDMTEEEKAAEAEAEEAQATGESESVQESVQESEAEGQKAENKEEEQQEEEDLSQDPNIYRPVVVYTLTKPCKREDDGCEHCPARLGVVHTSPAGKEFRREAIFQQQLERVFYAARKQPYWVFAGDYYLTPEAVVRLGGVSGSKQMPNRERNTERTTFQTNLPRKTGAPPKRQPLKRKTTSTQPGFPFVREESTTTIPTSTNVTNSPPLSFNFDSNSSIFGLQNQTQTTPVFPQSTGNLFLNTPDPFSLKAQQQGLEAVTQLRSSQDSSWPDMSSSSMYSGSFETTTNLEILPNEAETAPEQELGMELEEKKPVSFTPVKEFDPSQFTMNPFVFEPVTPLFGTNPGAWKPRHNHPIEPGTVQIADFAVCSTDWAVKYAFTVDTKTGLPVMDENHKALQEMVKDDSSDHLPVYVFVARHDASSTVESILKYPENAKELVKEESKWFDENKDTLWKEFEEKHKENELFTWSVEEPEEKGEKESKSTFKPPKPMKIKSGEPRTSESSMKKAREKQELRQRRLSLSASSGLNLGTLDFYNNMNPCQQKRKMKEEAGSPEEVPAPQKKRKAQQGCAICGSGRPMVILTYCNCQQMIPTCHVCAGTGITCNNCKVVLQEQRLTRQ